MRRALGASFSGCLSQVAKRMPRKPSHPVIWMYSRNYSVVQISNSRGKAIQLHYTDYLFWTPEEVVSVLRTPRSAGGVGISEADVEKLFGGDFDLGDVVFIVRRERCKCAVETTCIERTITILDNYLERVPRDTIEQVVNWVAINLIPRRYPNYKDDIPFQNLNVVKAMGEHLLRNCKVKREGLAEDSLYLLANFSFDGFGKTRIGVEFLELWRGYVSSHKEFQQQLILEFGESSFNQVFKSELIYFDLSDESFSEFDFERLSRIVPSDENKTYFIVFDEVPLFCSKGKHDMSKNMNEFWKKCLHRLQSQPNIVGIYACGKGALFDIFGTSTLREKLEQPSKCFHVDLQPIRIHDLESIFNEDKYSFVRDYLLDRGILQETMQRIIEESGGIPILVKRCIEELMKSFRDVFTVKNIDEIIGRVLFIPELYRFTKPWSDEKRTTLLQPIFSFLVLASSVTPFTRSTVYNAEKTSLSKIPQLTHFQKVSIFTLAALLNCYVEPCVDDTNQITLQFPKGSVEFYFSDFITLPTIPRILFDTPKLLHKANTFRTFISTFLVWRSIIGSDQNLTISEVFPFMKNTPAQHFPCPQLDSKQLNIKANKRNAPVIWENFASHWIQHLNKLNLFDHLSYGPEKFIVLSEKLIWAMQDKNVEKFNFTTNLYDEITNLKEMIPDDVHVIFTIFLRCETNLDKKIYGPNEIIHRPSRSRRSSNCTEIIVPNNMTILIAGKEEISHLILVQNYLALVQQHNS